MFEKKILTEVITPNEVLKKKYLIQNNKIIIRKPSKGRGHAGYLASFTKDCLLPYRSGFPFKTLKNKLMLIDGADRCISFKPDKDLTEVDLPIWDRQAEERLFQANVIKSAGAVAQKIQVPTFLYVVVGINLIIGVITLLSVRGMINI